MVACKTNLDKRLKTNHNCLMSNQLIITFYENQIIYFGRLCSTGVCGM